MGLPQPEWVQPGVKIETADPLPPDFFAHFWHIFAPLKAKKRLIPAQPRIWSWESCTISNQNSNATCIHATHRFADVPRLRLDQKNPAIQVDHRERETTEGLLQGNSFLHVQVHPWGRKGNLKRGDPWDLQHSTCVGTPLEVMGIFIGCVLYMVGPNSISHFTISTSCQNNFLN